MWMVCCDSRVMYAARLQCKECRTRIGAFRTCFQWLHRHAACMTPRTPFESFPDKVYHSNKRILFETFFSDWHQNLYSYFYTHVEMFGKVWKRSTHELQKLSSNKKTWETPTHTHSHVCIWAELERKSKTIASLRSTSQVRWWSQSSEYRKKRNLKSFRQKLFLSKIRWCLFAFLKPCAERSKGSPVEHQSKSCSSVCSSVSWFREVAAHNESKDGPSPPGSVETE